MLDSRHSQVSILGASAPKVPLLATDAGADKNGKLGKNGISANTTRAPLLSAVCPGLCGFRTQVGLNHRLPR